MPNQPPTTDIAGLGRATDSLAAQVGGYQAELRRSTRRSDRRTLIAIVVACAGLVCGILGWQAQSDADAQRAARTVIACEQSVVTAERDNAQDRALIALLESFLTPSADNPRTPEEQAQVEAFVAERTAPFRELQTPLRDCTPAGIAAYYDDDPSTSGFLPVEDSTP